MFELRWLEKRTGKTLMNEYGFYYDETQKVLQYRTKRKQTEYSVFIDNEKFQTIEKWSEWVDVPVIKEEGV